MAIHLEANYSKKLGLPGYSSHQYSVTIKTEVMDPNLVQAESNRLYELLQSCVDSQIQKTGFLPTNGQGTSAPIAHGNGPDAWACSPKQKDLILEVAYDFWGPGQGLLQKFGQGCQHLLQLYAVHKILHEAGKKGYTAQRQQLKDGSVKLVLLATGGAV